MNKSVVPVDTTVAPKKKSARILQREELQSTWRIGRPNEMDTSRFVPMAPRAARRASKHMKFRPVYNHAIPVREPHKAVVGALKIKDRRQALAWAPKLECALGIVAFGLAVKLFVADYTRTNRHNAMKAAGTWVEKRATLVTR